MTCYNLFGIYARKRAVVVTRQSCQQHFSIIPITSLLDWSLFNSVARLYYWWRPCWVAWRTCSLQWEIWWSQERKTAVAAIRVTACRDWRCDFKWSVYFEWANRLFGSTAPTQAPLWQCSTVIISSSGLEIWNAQWTKKHIVSVLDDPNVNVAVSCWGKGGRPCCCRQMFLNDVKL